LRISQPEKEDTCKENRTTRRRHHEDETSDDGKSGYPYGGGGDAARGCGRARRDVSVGGRQLRRQMERIAVLLSVET
jgi:hypothetical protein